MPNNVGENIANERHKQSMTQEQLADLSDITINYLSKIERGMAKQLSAKTLYQIAKGLGLSMNELMEPSPLDSTQKMKSNQRLLNDYLFKFDIDTREQLSKSLLNVLEISTNLK